MLIISVSKTWAGIGNQPAGGLLGVEFTYEAAACSNKKGNSHETKNTTTSYKKIIVALALILIAINPLTVHSQDVELIIGGYPADAGEYPWAAAIVGTGSSIYNRYDCGGTLIAPQWVLTAAHCVDDKLPSDIAVYLGSISLVDTTGSEYIAVDAIYVHPDYDDITNNADIALLHLEETSGQLPIALIDNSLLDDAGNIATVIGWGITDTDYPSVSEVLMEVDVPIISNATCNDSISYNGTVTDSMLCAGDSTGGIDACQGDSGGSLMVDGDYTKVQVGIVSWGDGCAQPNKYGVYTRLLEFTDWIFVTASVEVGMYYGCTDPNALNYVDYANFEDGSCEYPVVNITFANRDESGNNLYGTLEVDGVYPSINSEQVKEVVKDIDHTIRTHHEYRSNDTKKHHRWNENYNEFKMYHNNIFDVTNDGDEDIATFRNIYTISLDNNLSSTAANIDIKDPWFRDANGNQPGNVWIENVEQYNVFLDQQPNQGQVYSIRTTQLADVTQDNFIGFIEWRAYEPDGVTQDINENYVHISDPTDFNSCIVVFKQPGAVVKAVYGPINELSNYTLTIKENETLTIPSGADITFADNFTIFVNGGTVNVQNAKLTGTVDNGGIPTATMDITEHSSADVESSIVNNFALGFERHRQFANNAINLTHTVFDNVYVQVYGHADNYPMGINLLDINNCTWINSFMSTNLTGNNQFNLEWPLNLTNNIFFNGEFNLAGTFVDVINNYNLYFNSNINFACNPTCIIDEDPNFVDPQNGDYHLTSSSPAINAGEPDLDGDGETWQTDPDDQDPDYTRMDMGAYYHDTVPSAPTGFIISGSVGQNPTGSWAPNTEPDLAGYKLYKNEANSGWALLQTLDKNTTSYTDRSVTIGSGGKFSDDVCFKVTAFDIANQQSSYSVSRCKPLGGVSKQMEIIPDDYALHAAFPNPFNPTTSIRFDIPEKSSVSMVIYNVLGREIKKLVSGELVSGYHQAIWDGKDDRGNPVPSGLYIYQFSAISEESKNQFQGSNKLVLMK